MSRDTDSYTGEPIELDYVSPFKGINKPRTLYKPDGQVTAQYRVSPRAEGWIVVRDGCPESFFPRFPTAEIAGQVMDWLVANDGSVGVAIHWIKRGDLGPLLSLLDRIQEVVREAGG